MTELSCLCGQVHVAVEKLPDFINECNCTLCNKSGARWGYFHPDQVKVTGATKGYSRADKADPNAEVHFCETCGATTHFVLTPAAQAKFGNTMIGVNMWLADEKELAGIELRFPDGRSWDGASEFGYLREARVLG